MISSEICLPRPALVRELLPQSGLLIKLKSILSQELERLQKEKDRLDRREKEQRGEIDRYALTINHHRQCRA